MRCVCTCVCCVCVHGCLCVRAPVGVPVYVCVFVCVRVCAVGHRVTAHTQLHQMRSAAEAGGSCGRHRLTSGTVT